MTTSVAGSFNRHIGWELQGHRPIRYWMTGAKRVGREQVPRRCAPHPLRSLEQEPADSVETRSCDSSDVAHLILNALKSLAVIRGLPRLVRVVTIYAFGDFESIRPQVLLVHNSVVADHECIDTGDAILSRSG